MPIRDAAEREQAARVELEESFRALGFDPDGLGAEKGAPKARASGKGSSSSSSTTRAPTAGEEAQANISRQSAGCPSPFAHCNVACLCLPSSSSPISAGGDRSSSSPVDHHVTDLDHIITLWTPAGIVVEMIVACLFVPVVMIRRCGIVVAVWFFALLCHLGSAEMPGPSQGSWKSPADAGPGPASSSSNPWAPMVEAQQGTAKARAEGTPPRTITGYSEPRKSARQLVQQYEAAATASAPKPVQRPRPGSQSVVPAPGAADQQAVIAPGTAEVTEGISLEDAPWKAAPPPLAGAMPGPPLMTPQIKRPAPRQPEGPPAKRVQSEPAKTAAPVFEDPSSSAKTKAKQTIGGFSPRPLRKLQRARQWVDFQRRGSGRRVIRLRRARRKEFHGLTWTPYVKPKRFH